ncbi:MAG TPA: transketolase family protein [Candidatus Goldiibacteriota bacterium]|nr:transketolase family protein [Candidatus Goldiibacteriota bacterium]
MTQTKGAMTSMRNTYGDTLVKLGEKHKNLVVLDADLAKSTQTLRFGKKFPERFFDMGIAEQDMMGTAAGLAASGMNPFASTFAMFGSGRPWEQIRNSIAYPNLPVKIVVTHAGISVGPDGPTHQACEDIAIMRAIPNMKIVAPADSVETEKLITFLAEYYDSPVYVRLARMNSPVVFGDDYEFEFGKARIIRKGSDIAIISTGMMLVQAMAAAEMLAKDGISAEVIHMPTVKPLDEKAVIEAARATGRIITLEEHSIIGGLGSAVAEVLAEKQPAVLARLGIRDRFAESGEPDELFEKYGISEKHVYKTAVKMAGEKVNGKKPKMKAKAKKRK